MRWLIKNFWLEHIQADWIVLDIGANVGIFTVLFSKTCKKVYAFEPVEETLVKLHENIKANKCDDNIVIVKKAVSNKTGRIQDKIHSQWETEVQDKEFDFTTIDDWVKENKVQVDAIKIDVDGFDYEVLLGAEQTLKSQKPLVVVEINHALQTRNFNAKYPLEFMKKIGYTEKMQLDQDNFVFKHGNKP